MNRDEEHFHLEYASALNRYLSVGGETNLTHAYELGRRAVTGGYGVLDLAELHQQAMLELVEASQDGSDVSRMLTLSGDFLKEALSAYEITHLGFREATDLLRHALQFGTVVCHELKAPLTSILASSGMLKDIMAPSPNSMEGKLLANIVAGASRMKVRVDSLNDIIGLESGIQRLNLSRVNLVDLIAEVHQYFGPQLEQEGLTLYAVIDEHVPVVLADRDRLEQVMCNLVDNAIKYGSEGKVIYLRAGLKDNAVLIEVQDFGQGIPMWDRPKLFQERFRGEKDRHRVQGLGVGLALCNAIVSAHSGKIWAESEEGKGTTFKVLLPLHNSPSVQEVTYESASNRGRPGNS